MNKKLLNKISVEFDIEINNVRKSDNAALAEVYVINNSLILRGRRNYDSAVNKLNKELDLIGLIKSKVGVKFPELKMTNNGNFYIEELGLLWTIYPLIKGNIICSWYNLEKVDDDTNKKLFSTLRKIHKNTKGIFRESDLSYYFLKDIQEKFNNNYTLIPKTNRKCITIAIEKISEKIKGLTIKDLCFVHGDFHYGNVVYNNKNNIVGILDLDWCRVGYYLEDLAFTIMMFLRSYKYRNFIFDQDKFLKLINFYKIKDSEIKLLKEYLILYTFFDVCIFNEALELSKRKFYFEYQRQFLSNICSRF